MSHLDLAPTILDLAGVAVPEVFQGHPVWARRDNPAAVVVSENAGRGLCRIGEKPLFLAVRSRSHKTIARAENFEPEILEFYDLSQDPFECNNQAGCAGHEEIRREHLTQIRARLSRLRTETDASEGVSASLHPPPRTSCPTNRIHSTNTGRPAAISARSMDWISSRMNQASNARCSRRVWRTSVPLIGSKAPSRSSGP